MASSAKPLAPATKVVRTCICGRVVPRKERLCLVDPKPCSNCGSRRRCWEMCPATWLDKLLYRWQLKKWKKSSDGKIQQSVP